MRPRQSESRDSAPHELPLCYPFICKAPTKLIVGSECTLSPQVFPGLSTNRPVNGFLGVTVWSAAAVLHAGLPRLKVLSHFTDGAFRVPATTSGPLERQVLRSISADPIMGGFQCKVRMWGFFYKHGSDFRNATAEPRSTGPGWCCVGRVPTGLALGSVPRPLRTSPVLCPQD